MRIGCLNGEEKKEIVFRVNEDTPNTLFTQNTHAIFAEIAVCASDKGENGKRKTESSQSS